MSLFVARRSVSAQVVVGSGKRAEKPESVSIPIASLVVAFGGRATASAGPIRRSLANDVCREPRTHAAPPLAPERIGSWNGAPPTSAAAQKRADPWPTLERERASVREHQHIDVAPSETRDQLRDTRCAIDREPFEACVEHAVLDGRCVDGGKTGGAKHQRARRPRRIRLVAVVVLRTVRGALATRWRGRADRLRRGAASRAPRELHGRPWSTCARRSERARRDQQREPWRVAKR